MGRGDRPRENSFFDWWQVTSDGYRRSEVIRPLFYDSLFPLQFLGQVSGTTRLFTRQMVLPIEVDGRPYLVGAGLTFFISSFLNRVSDRGVNWGRVIETGERCITSLALSNGKTFVRRERACLHDKKGNRPRIDRLVLVSTQTRARMITLFGRVLTRRISCGLTQLLSCIVKMSFKSCQSMNFQEGKICHTDPYSNRDIKLFRVTTNCSCYKRKDRSE